MKKILLVIDSNRVCRTPTLASSSLLRFGRFQLQSFSKLLANSRSVVEGKFDCDIGLAQICSYLLDSWTCWSTTWDFYCVDSARKFVR